jgi:hypothetical protein
LDEVNLRDSEGQIKEGESPKQQVEIVFEVQVA